MSQRPVEPPGHPRRGDPHLTCSGSGFGRRGRTARHREAPRGDQTQMTVLDHQRVIAIDGPGAAGKSTVALQLAEHLGALLFDTGALYRAVTLASLRDGIGGADPDALARLIARLRIEIKPASVADGRQIDVLLDGEDVTWAIRIPEIDAQVSEVAAHPQVRDALLPVQREIADGKMAVLVGRDIGTVVIPLAGTKIYLDASTPERARRRLRELGERGITASFETVLRDLERRDAHDSGRATSPLRAAPDAIVIATDGRSIEEIVNEIETTVRSRWEARRAANDRAG